MPIQTRRLIQLGWTATALAGLTCPGCAMLQPNPQAQQQQSSIGEGVQTQSNKSEAAASIDVTKTEEHDDIFQIANFLPSNPWLRQSGKVVGIQVPAYFVSSATRKGAFVPGTILAWVYGFEAGPDGKPQRVPLHVWEYDRNQAMDWRITKKRAMGNPYMFLLRWPDGLDLAGRYIELELGYERMRDKSIVTGSAKRLRVPGDDSPPMPPTATPPASRMANTRKTG